MADPILSIRFGGEEIGRIFADELPVELKPSVPIRSGASLEFVDCGGAIHRHDILETDGWCHLSVRLHASRVCQGDGIVSDQPDFDPQALPRGKAAGYRFQPFFHSTVADPPDLRGQGLFARGLHYRGIVTPGNVLLSCECDVCRRSFLTHSFHSGFSDLGYMYSASGAYTLTIPADIPGAPAPRSAPEPVALAELEQRLAAAPDGSRFRYSNPFRCPHCGAAFIDFEAHPGLREQEYYGLYLVGSSLLHLDDEARA